MTARHPPGGRQNLILRLLAIGAVLLFSYESLRRGVAWSFRERNIDAAYLIAPDDARVASAWSSASYDFGERASARSPALAAAKSALARDATEVQAIATLAFDADARGDRARALALAKFGQELSRRDLKTQLFLLQTAVERNDIKDALTHYDYALRTSDQAPSVLFPVLMRAVGFPEVRRNLVETLSHRPPWGSVYLYDLASKGPDPSAASALVADLHKAGVVVPADVDDILIGRLVEQGHIAQAWQNYQARFPGARADTLRNGSFNRQYSSTPFDWSFPEVTGLDARLSREDGHGRLDYEAISGVGGVAVRQLLVLSEGTYHLAGSAAVSPADEALAPSWKVRCTDGRTVGTVLFQKETRGSARFEGDISIPATCYAQWLELAVPTSDAIEGNRGSIAHITITAMQR